MRGRCGVYCRWGILFIGLLYIGYVAPQSMAWSKAKTVLRDATQDWDVREGDLVFQHLPGTLVRVIAQVTDSPYSHCGIVVRHKRDWYVLEAIGPVKLTRLNEWIHRGLGSQVTVARLEEAYQTMIPDMISAGYVYMGKPYDILYEWDEDKIYCSELIYKAALKGGQIKLAEFQRLGDMNWKPNESFIREITGGECPLEREMITPHALVTSDKVRVVYSSFKNTGLQ